MKVWVVWGRHGIEGVFYTEESAGEEVYELEEWYDDPEIILEVSEQEVK